MTGRATGAATFFSSTTTFVGAGVGAAGFSTTFSAAGAAVLAASNNGFISSPFSPKIARIESTGAPFPSSTPIYKSTPS